MRLLITGVSHKTAPVAVREQLAFREQTLGDALADLTSRTGVHEALILSTCNRVEIAVTTDDDCDAGATVDSFLEDHKPGASRDIEPHRYRYEGRDAIHHLFRVASSLDSMIVGEPQILGQLKAAYSAAKASGALQGPLDALLERAFSVAKRVRSETGVGQMAVSISYAAVELARKIFGSLERCTVMIAGAGKMSELAARHLRRSGATRVLVTNRTWERAVEMAALFDGTPIEYGGFTAALPEVDILIASSGAPHYILNKADVQAALSARRNRPVFLIDIAVPRNIDPEVNELENVYLYDIDDLREVVSVNQNERRKEAEHAEALVAEEVEHMVARLHVARVGPTIAGLQQQLEQIRSAELDKARRKYGPFSAAQEEALEAITRGIVNKIAHGPITEIREHAGRPEGEPVIAAFRKAFHLQD